jgi:hypothetical protein
MKQLIEKNWEYGKEFLMSYINYKKAFNSVKREEITRSSIEIGVSADLLRKVKNTYKSTINFVKINKERSVSYEPRLGLRQGRVLTPILFNIIMNDVCNKIKI